MLRILAVSLVLASVLLGGTVLAQDLPEARWRRIGGSAAVNDATHPIYTAPSTGAVSDVNLSQVAGVAVSAGAGAVAAGTQRVTLASDDPAVAALVTVSGWSLGAAAVDATTLRTVEASNSLLTLAAQTIAGWTLGGGLADATTQRVYEADDSLLSAGVQAIADAVAAPGGPIPPSVVLLGGDDGIATRALVADTAGALTVAAAQLPAALGAQAQADSLSVVQATADVWETNQTQIAGTAVDVGAGADSAGSLRVVEASRDGSAYSGGTVTQGAGDTTIAARAARKWALVQNVDAGGALCVALGATTNACADCHLLDAAAAAGESGGTWQIGDWGGAISVCAPDAGTTISYRVTEAY